MPADPHKLATAPQLLPTIMKSSPTTTMAAEAATAEAPTTAPTEGPVEEAVAAAEATRTATPPEPHRAATTPARRLRNYSARRLRRQATTTASPPSLRDFVTSSQRNFKPLGITKYDAKQDPIQWLRCYTLSIENAGGNNDTKCLYFPFCLDQAPLTWLESLDKHSIDKWD
jgi:septal ring-binding cell division protein DamX